MNASEIKTERLEEGWVVMEGDVVVQGLVADGPSVFATEEEAEFAADECRQFIEDFGDDFDGVVSGPHA